MMYRISRPHNLSRMRVNIPLISRCLSICLLTAAFPLFGNPVRGSVVAGSASINYGATTVITEQSNKAIVNWQDFSIQQGETTRFVQPSSSAVILNRVTGANVSQILGNLQANGQVFLVNPNGIVFGKNAQVNVAGLMATTANITDTNFMNGIYHFTNAPAYSQVINNGKISIGQAGYAALVAPQVQNNGVIHATLGKVTLASGTDYTVDLYGDNLITLDANSVVNNASVSNAGKIIAKGGTVVLTAPATRLVVQNLINMSGYIQASSMSNQSGKVQLLGGANTTVQISGTINVSGKNAGEKGGLVQVSSNYVELLDGSLIDVSGALGGGNVNIGSDVFHNPGYDQAISTQGTPSSLPTSNFVYGAPGSNIIADALISGNGGQVVVWSSDATWYYGYISAAARGAFGNGGHIETSGHYLDVTGARVDTRAAAGQTGIWLLDPYDVTIADGTGGGGDFNGSNPNTFTPSSSGEVVGVSTINTNLGSADVIITTTGAGADAGTVTFTNTTSSVTPSGNDNFTVNATGDIDLSSANQITNTGSGTINLLAGGNINITAAGAITNTGGGTINLQAASNNSGTVGGSAGAVNLVASSVSTTGGAVNIYYYPTSGNYANIVTYTSAVTGAATLVAYQLFNSATDLTNLAFYVIHNLSSSFDYAQGHDIDMNSVGFGPITDHNNPYHGIFTGADAYSLFTYQYLLSTYNGYAIDNLTINIPGGVAGLFGGFVGTMSNMRMFNPTIVGGDAGALVAEMRGTLTGMDYVIGGTVTAQGTGAGGLFAFDDSSINATYLYNSATVTAANGVAGGIIGNAVNDSIIVPTIVNIGNVSATAANAIEVGGIFGLLTLGPPRTFTVTSITNSGNVSCTNTCTAVGGIAGEIGSTLSATTLQNSGNISAPLGTDVGGIIGSVTGGGVTSTYSFSNTPTVTGFTNVGGFIGLMTGNPTLTETSFTNTGEGTITGSGSASNVGGLFGQIQGGIFSATTPTFTNSVAVTSTAGTAIGGVIGLLSGGTMVAGATYTNNSTGTITGATDVGGVIGQMTGSALGSATVATSLSSAGNINTTVTTANANIGGIIGDMSGGSIQGSLSNSGQVGNATLPSNNSSAIGGLIGLLEGGTLTSPSASIAVNFNNLNTGSVYGTSNVGGLIGWMTSGFIDPSSVSSTISNTATVSATGSDVGGLVGWFKGGTFQPAQAIVNTNSGTIKDSGTNNNIGGVIGYYTSPTVNLATYTNNGIISALNASSVGGVIGALTALANTTITLNSAIYTENGSMSAADAITDGAVITGVSNVGGLVGTWGGSTGTVGTGGFFGTVNYTNPHANVNAITATGSNIGGAVGFAGTSSGANFSFFKNAGGLTVNSSSAGALFTTISGGSNVGGVVGDFDLNSYYTMGNSMANDNKLIVTGSGSNIGGVVGLINGPTELTGPASPFLNTFTNNAAVQSSGSGTGIGGVIGSITSGTFAVNATMSNLGTVTANSATDVGAVIGQISDSGLTLSSLLTNSKAISGSSAVGGVIGAATAGTISSTYSFSSTPTVTGTTNVGGFMGLLNGATLAETAFTNTGEGTITGSGSANNIGGLFGQIESGSFTGATPVFTNKVVVTASNGTAIGGVVGLLSGGTFVAGASYTNNATGVITGSTDVGGVIGQMTGGTLGSNTVATSLSNLGNINTAVTAANSNIGGDIGDMTGGTIEGSLSNAAQVGNSTLANNNSSVIGGLIGLLEGGTLTSPSASVVVNIKNLSAGAVYGNTDVGGLMGEMSSGTVNPSDTSSVISNAAQISGLISNVGGIIGLYSGGTFQPASLITTTNSGNITGPTRVGGLVGLMSGGAIAGSNSGNIDTAAASGTTDIGGDIGSMSSTAVLTSTMTLSNSGNVGNSSTLANTSNVGGNIGEISGGSLSSFYALSNTAGTVAGNTNIGGAIGYIHNNSTYDDAFNMSNTSSVTVEGLANIGGFIGNIDASTTITDLTFVPTTWLSHATVNSSTVINSIGGIFGVVGSGLTILNSLQNNGNITDTNSTALGGIMSYTTGVTFEGSMTNLGTISGHNDVGGLFGEFAGSTFNDNKAADLINESAITSTGNNIGGVFGVVDSSANINIDGMSNTNAVTGAQNVGGIAGLVASTTTAFTTANGLSNSATIQGTLDVGGIIGQMNAASSSDMNNQGTVSGTKNTGGVIGELSDPGAVGVILSGTLTNLGTVTDTGGDAAGGIVGLIDTNGVLSGTLNEGLSGSPGAIIADSGSTGIGEIVGSITTGGNLTANTVTVDASSTMTFSTSTQFITNVGGIIGELISGGLFTGFNTVGYSIGTPVIATGNVNPIINVGGVIGYASGVTLNTALSSLADVTGDENVGGVIGGADNSDGTTIISAVLTNTNNVTGNISTTGGVIGGADNITISNDLNGSGTISGVTNTGGIIGYAIALTYSGTDQFTGSVSGTTNTGGIVGQMDSNSTADMNNQGTVSGTTNTGGLAGLLSGGTITGSNVGDIDTAASSGTTNVGGNIGSMSSTTAPTSSMTLSNTGSVGNSTTLANTNNVGGNIGELNGGDLSAFYTLSNTAGTVAGSGNIGGAIGDIHNTSTVDVGASISTGFSATVKGLSNIGGLIGNMDNTTVFTNTTGTPSTWLNEATVSSTASINSIGGAFGVLGSGLTIINAVQNSGSVTDTHSTGLGGIMGYTTGVTFEGSMTNQGTIKGAADVGGLFGDFSGSTINDTLTAEFINQGGVTGTGNNTGGVFAVLEAGAAVNADLLVNEATVIGVQNTGGVAGLVASTISTLTATQGLRSTSGAAAIGDTDTGGIIGQMTASSSATMKNQGGIQGITNTGGIVGEFADTGSIGATLSGTLTNVGNVSDFGGDALGGIVGLLDNHATLSGTLHEGFAGVSATVNAYTIVGVSSGVSNIVGSITTGADLTASTVSVDSTSQLNFNTNSNNITNVGGIVGELINGGGFTGFNSGGYSMGAPILANGNVNPIINVGGLIGYASGVTLSTNMNSLANVSGDDAVGGLIGSTNNVYGATIISATLQNSNTVTSSAGSQSIGGVIGIIGATTVSGDLLDSGTVSGTTNIGGVAGYIANSTLSGVNQFTGTATGSTNTGGVAGVLDGSTISQAVMAGTVNGDAVTGGVVGAMINGSTLNQAYNNSNHTVNTTGQYAGGIAGTVDSSSSISNVLFGGTIDTSASADVGGIAGQNQGTITNALSVGTFNTSGATNVGAIVGDNSTGTINTSVYDTRAFASAVGTGASTGALGSSNSNLLAGPGLYTSGGYNWDFISTWFTSAGNYPALTFCTVECTVPLRNNPTPQPSPIFPINPSIIQSIITTNAINQANQDDTPPEPDPVDALLITNLPYAYQQILINSGLPGTVLSQVILVTPLIESYYYTYAEQQATELSNFSDIIQALDNYYYWCSNPTSGSEHNGRYTVCKPKPTER